MDIGFTHLRYFYEVARLGGFSKASRTLLISQPALSKAVKQLEVKYEVSLLNRKQNGTTLMEPGKILYLRCQELFQKINDIELEVKNTQEDCSGPLNIGASDNLSGHVLPKIVLSFLNRYPKVDLKLFTGTAESIQKEILQENISGGLFFNRPTHPRIQFQIIGQAEFAVIASIHQKKALGNDDFLNVIRAMRFIGSRSTDYSTPYLALRILSGLGVRPTRKIECNNQEVQKNFALQGLGYTVLPKFMIQKEIDAGLAFVVPFKKRLKSPVYWAGLRNAKSQKSSLIFMDYLRADIQKVL